MRPHKYKVMRVINTGLCLTISKVRKFEPAENLVIFSDPRGGSTWMAEVISHLPHTVILWEPLHLDKVPYIKQLGFGWQQFIPENETWPEAERAFEKIFSGKLINHWTSYMASPLAFLRADRMIIKICRANAMIPWITRTFQFKYDPIYMVRHPFAVVASQLQHGAWKRTYTGFRLPDCPYNDLYVRHADFLFTLKTKEEWLVAAWCLTNLIPLQNARNNSDWITVYYEDMISNPEQELDRIFERWKLPLPANILDQIRSPSSTTKEATFLKSIEQQLSKWQSFFSPKQIEKNECHPPVLRGRDLYDRYIPPCSPLKGGFAKSGRSRDEGQLML